MARTPPPPFVAHRLTVQQPAPNPEQAAIFRTRTSRQAAFERGILLTLIVACMDAVERMAHLKNGAKWVVTDTDIEDLSRTLRRMHESVLRYERLEED